MPVIWNPSIARWSYDYTRVRLKSGSRGSNTLFEAEGFWGSLGNNCYLLYLLLGHPRLIAHYPVPGNHLLTGDRMTGESPTTNDLLTVDLTSENLPGAWLTSAWLTGAWLTGWPVTGDVPGGLRLLGLGGSAGWVIRLETRRSRVQSPPRSATFFRRDWSWNIFYGHSLPSADSRRAVVSFWQKNVHNTG